MAPKSFDPNDKHFFLCCGFCHVKTGAILFVVWELLSCLGGVELGRRTTGCTSTSVLVGVVAGACLALLVWGLVTERASFLLPQLVLIAIELVLAFIGTVYFIYCVAFNWTEIVQAYEELGKEAGKAEVLMVTSVLLVILQLALHVWFLWVLRASYFYFQEKHDAFRERTAGPGTRQPPAQLLGQGV